MKTQEHLAANGNERYSRWDCGVRRRRRALDRPACDARKPRRRKEEKMRRGILALPPNELC